MTTTQPCTCPKCQPTPPPASAPEGTPVERWLTESERFEVSFDLPSGRRVRSIIERLCALLDDKEADLARWKEMYGEECDAGNLLEKLRLKAEADLASIRSERSKLDQRITDECLARESAERDLAAAREREGKLAMEVTGMQRENSRLTARCIQAEADLAAARVELGLVSGALVDAGEVEVGSTGTEYAAAIGDLTRRLAAAREREERLRQAASRVVGAYNSASNLKEYMDELAAALAANKEGA